MSSISYKTQPEVLGDFLKRTRQMHGWQLKDIERRTKISEIYLQALEENDYYKLPSPTYARGFLEHYAEFLGLNTKQIIDRYRHESKFFEERGRILASAIAWQKNKRGVAPKQRALPGFNESLKKKIANLDFHKVLIGLIAVAFLGYFTWVIGQAVFPPKIVIFSPTDNLEIHERSIQVKGRVNAKSTVKINDQSISKIEEGFFDETLELAPGVNFIKISAKKKNSPESVIWRRVIVNQ